MVLVKGTFTKSFGKGLAKAFKENLDKYALGFRVTREMVEDDLYGGILKKKRTRRPQVQLIYRLEAGPIELELTGGTISIDGRSHSIESIKEIVKGLNTLLKLAKKPAKKVIRRKRKYVKRNNS
jgi:hypothetical protein